MALSEAFIDQHIATWEQALRSPFHPYREKWPSRLFHHAPVDNAVLILRDGHLRSRNDPENHKNVDVAAAGVIDNRVHAHQFARLYFRPRTPTQWHIEGIRKPGECTYGDAAHAPILVMMIFDAKRVLMRDGVQFCDRNMQLGAAVTGQTEQYFSAIPFAKVFHEGPTSDRSVIDHRCAEVLAASPLPLNDTVQWIYCRTAAERTTLLHLLGPHGVIWKNRILISDDLLVFERKYTFVEEVSVDNKGVVIKLSPRQDRQAIDVQVRVTASDGALRINFRNNSMAARPDPPSNSWRISGALNDGDYLVEVTLEGRQAYLSSMSVGFDNLF
jgi:hypothetical protein